MEPRKQQFNFEPKEEYQILKKGSLCFLYALLAALIQAEGEKKPKKQHHSNFEKQYCIVRIMAKLENSRNPAGLLDKAQNYLQFQKQ